jgi:putative beta-lysine N-acetyltransferase
MSIDKIEKIHNSLFQHGKHNNRIYLLKLDRDNADKTMQYLLNLAKENKYRKIIAKVPSDLNDRFADLNFKREAFIPGFFNGEGEVSFLSIFLDDNINPHENKNSVDEIISLAKSKAKNTVPTTRELPGNHTLRLCNESDTQGIVKIYEAVFPSYPFPIHDPEYIRRTMKTHIRYYGVFEGDNLIAVSSAEMDKNNSNAEMTDFAVPQKHRCKGLALFLLKAMEKDMKKLEVKTLCTIARAASPGMNIVFAKNGYEYSGTLFKNTNIMGKIEDMNVWYKK